MIDILEEAAHREGYEVKFQIRQFQGSLRYLERGKIDILPRAICTQERTQFMDFLGPIGYEQKEIVFLVKPGKEDSIREFDDLKHLTVGVKRGTVSMYRRSVFCPPLWSAYPSQILTNVVMNSLNYEFSPGSQGTIERHLREEQDTFRMRYSDNGKGMKPEECSRIFEPFYTTKRGQGRSGLGLHIVYNLVTQRLNGSITCESEPDKGTAFMIQIPLEESNFLTS